eukprot:CAMPEP_0201721318 /NCGR_PEP_ID=MMETSP0593-20130828/6013_1 /ASSEMBLY_ACC=CAM_ASM_000672 /TAXON_ID=267983 /ORGANISM="Skeletonema japonicum, Strain CCMP2506" /LENGTH=168 /DNA_ID=CAMNT_0048212107 /DNA_START=10 /DNA_END=516 /DNA_ORIENTATION=+
MKSIASILHCCYLLLCLDGTVSYSTLSSLPVPRLLPSPPQWSSVTIPRSRPTADVAVEPLQNMKSVFRRAKNRLQTLVRKKTEKKKQKEPEEMWQVLFHDTEYLPGHVARALAKVFPISRKAAFEICLRAREEGMVPLTVCSKKQAEKYCGAILRKGLVATIEPLDFS